MATQSLYRRFRPRKFSELYGQKHIVKALRNAVIAGREGQAYLFSGPRGTGKTTTARILAKVLNCAEPVDGEPCCACESCLAVDNGISYDVLELDAASNRGINEIRDIIDAAALNSPGRHRVFILDEAHQLTGPATVALLKTLEEPPEHVVFVLATTDPQKIPETIRSRVQHLQFHLLPIPELEKYVRHVIAEAGLVVDEDAIAQVLRQGGGSARDTLSALELVAAGGGGATEGTDTDDMVRAITERDHGAALAAVARAVQSGRDPRAFTDDLVRTLRDCFLAIMSPDLVQAPAARLAEVDAMGRALGPQRTVQAMETLGEMLVEMRHAPDTRLLLEVAVVRLASPAFDDSVENLMVRIKQLEDDVRELRTNGGGAGRPAGPINPTTGRAQVGGLAHTGGNPRPAAASEPMPATAETSSTEPSPASAEAPAPRVAAPAPASAPAAPVAPAKTSSAGDPAQLWPQVIDSLTKFSRALFRTTTVSSVDGQVVTVRLSGNTPLKRAEEQAASLQAAITAVCGGKWRVAFVHGDPTSPGGIARVEIPASDDDTPVSAPRVAQSGILRAVADDPFAPVDPDELIDADPGVGSVVEALLEQFPEGRLEDATESANPVVADKPATKPRSRGKK
ncbi:MAG: DNA polymerase III subunit gamma/tau [Actinomycetota bacterium]